MKLYGRFMNFILLLSACSALPTRYNVHEKLDLSTSKLVARDLSVDPTTVLPVSIALAQQNLENGYDYLMNVSHPDSPHYGKHWTSEMVAARFSSSSETISSVKSWLSDHGFEEDKIRLSIGRNWLRMNLTIQEAERLLQTKYKVIEHQETGKRSLACEEYSLPVNLQRHIDYITPTIDSALTLTRVKVRQEPSEGTSRWKHPSTFRNATGLPPPIQSESGALARRWHGSNELSWNLTVCGSFITRACILALYNMPNGTVNISSFAVVEYYDESFVQSDLSLYMRNLVTTTIGADLVPRIHVMSDATFQPGTITTSDPWDVLGEGNVDLQMAFGIAYPQSITYYQANSDDVFLDALDASYCSISGDTTSCGTTPLASVISTSWGGGESVGSAAQIRQCNEYMKLGLLGSTVLFSTGDSGVGSSCTTFQIDFPASCPYVTSVGATQIPNGGTVKSKEVAWGSSGGGFSNQWPLPSYQSSAITTYFKNHAPAYNSSVYNNTQKARGYPDVSANGYDTLLTLQGNWVQGEGTSISTPIIGGLITLINQQRLNAKKSTVGFINPVLYANPSALNDITSGTNPGCGTNGFSAVTGWDPVTGLGTPDYEKLLTVWMALS